MIKKALITGITGQDGSYLAELLIDKGYEVHGIIRRSSTFNTGRLCHIYQDPHERSRRLILHYGDLTDASNLHSVLSSVQPDEIYNLAAQSHVKVSFELPVFTADVIVLGTLRLLEAVRAHCPRAKFYQAGSSEMFGQVREIPQTETTPFYPRSPYGCAKVCAHHLAVNYREAYNLFVVNGILFNHESPRRGKTFVTRKITRGLAQIKLGLADKLFLGNLEAKRDWGYAKDYVAGMWLMLQQPAPDDYILATGENHTVREFAEAVARALEFDLVWEGQGLAEKGLDRKSGQALIEIDPQYFRPTEVDLLLGDATHAREKLNWQPTVKFNDLAKIMALADFKKLNKKYAQPKG